MKKVLLAIVSAVVKSFEISNQHNASARNVWMQETTRW
jgi:hypothetical protein